MRRNTTHKQTNKQINTNYLAKSKLDKRKKQVREKGRHEQRSKGISERKQELK